MKGMTDAASESAVPRWRAALVIVVGLALAAGVAAHWPDWLMGTYYWKWWWTRLPAAGIYGGLALAAVPLFVGLILFERGKIPLSAAIELATLTAFAERIGWVCGHSQALDLSYLAYAVRHPYITSFYVDAASLTHVKGWLAHYDELSLGLNVHSRNKPPGAILFYSAFIKLMGNSEETARIAGLVLAGLQAASVIACAFLLRVLSRSDRVTVYGSCYFAMCPGFVLPFPMFDPLYTLFVAPLCALWVLAIERNRVWISVVAALVLTLASLMMFNFLVIGFFMVGVALFAGGRSPSATIFRFARHGTVMIGVTLVVYLLLGAFTGYNPISTFVAACRNQRLMDMSPLQVRPYPRTLVFDLVDFALGSGWMSFMLAGMCVVAMLRSDPRSRLTRIVVLCLLQLLVVAVSGLLQAETLRVWNFLLPLLMLPVGMELARCSAWQRLGVFVALWLVLGAMAQNMIFH